MTTYIGGTTGVAPAQWTTSGRPSSPQNGQLGWNTTLNALEVWNGIIWVQTASQSYTVNYLIVGGGGAGNTNGASAGAGGTGGGATGSSGSTPTAATANLGGGGGGGYGVNGTGGAGGSGIVILSVPTANYSGTTTGSPTITTSGSNTILTFTASGSYTA